MQRLPLQQDEVTREGLELPLNQAERAAPFAPRSRRDASKNGDSSTCRRAGAWRHGVSPPLDVLGSAPRGQGVRHDPLERDGEREEGGGREVALRRGALAGRGCVRRTLLWQLPCSPKGCMSRVLRASCTVVCVGEKQEAWAPCPPLPPRFLGPPPHRHTRQRNNVFHPSLPPARPLPQPSLQSVPLATFDTVDDFLKAWNWFPSILDVFKRPRHEPEKVERADERPGRGGRPIVTEAEAYYILKEGARPDASFRIPGTDEKMVKSRFRCEVSVRE